MNFYNLNDDELIYYVKEHNEKALRLLLDKYMIVSRKIIRDMNFSTFEAEELLNDCNELILKCLKTYKICNASFYSYYCVSLKRVLFKRKEKNRKLYVLNEDDYVRILNGTEDKRNIILHNYLNQCTKFQKLISDLLLKGYSIKGISSMLKVPVSKIYYELKKMNNKK